MSKNVALFFDGTWNRPQENGGAEANTNVRKLFLATEKTGQIARYICGVGSGDGRFRKPLAGAGGLGVSRNIQKGYEKLVKYFRESDGDHLYLFGFSRGAYTARSMAGFLNYVGLLLESHIADVPKAFELYKSRANVQDSDLLPFLRKQLGRDDVAFASLPVYLIGVWDTVGRLGIPDPLGVIPDRVVRFHRTDLPKNVTHARQALALHELRSQFEPVPWTSHVPEQTLKQVWFSGAHGDIGGGYCDARLSDITLRWMASEAMRPDGSASGLHVNETLLPLRPDALGPVQHELKKWFALNPSSTRSALKRRPTPGVDTMEVAESARYRCWEPTRPTYSAWRPDVKWALNRIDRLTLQFDLWMLYKRPSFAPGAKPWWAKLRPKHVAEVVTHARQLIATKSFIDGPSATLTIQSAFTPAQTLCVLFLYGGPEVTRELIDSCDQRFIQARKDLEQLAAVSDAALRRQADAWKQLVHRFADALSDARELLPPALVGAYGTTLQPPSVSAHGALDQRIFELTRQPIKFK
jgi:hypothetical protein